MKFLGVPPPRTTDAVRGRRMITFADSTMSPMMSMWPALGVLLARLREAHADGRIGDGRTEDRHVGAVGRREDAVSARCLPELAAELIQEFARGVRPVFEGCGKVGNPVVVADEFFLAGVRIVHAIDPALGQRRVVGVRRSDVVPPAPRFVKIVIQVGARRDETIDVAVLNQVGDDHPEAAGAQCASHAEKDRHVVFEHLLPDPERRREIPPLK